MKQKRVQTSRETQATIISRTKILPSPATQKSRTDFSIFLEAKEHVFPGVMSETT
ncbi:hypothetical protein RRSWK_00955 [Rhodopirellula sp. SWK7]|nr:hypothetical protein RRSWK_00955 [Rhodopirellula sp. SWK7]